MRVRQHGQKEINNNMDKVIVYTNSMGYHMLAMPDGTKIPMVIFTDTMQGVALDDDKDCTVLVKLYCRVATPDEAKAIDEGRYDLYKAKARNVK